MLVYGQAVILVPDPSNFSPPFEFVQHGARNQIRLIGFSAFSQDRQLRRLVNYCNYKLQLSFGEVSLHRPGRTGRGYSYILLYRYVPLKRVWFSSHLVWYRV